jgi:predicted Rdx family selenoprotein
MVVLFLAVVAYVIWEYRQGSFPKSRLKREAKRAARRTRELNHEDRRQKPTERSD